MSGSMLSKVKYPKSRQVNETPSALILVSNLDVFLKYMMFWTSHSQSHDPLNCIVFFCGALMSLWALELT